MLNEFNEGGTHEENKLGGIPQGMGQNGQMNTVEEGETKKDNFIYSDRIKLTPELVSQFNLPKMLSNKTAAEATKIINTKFEGRNSTIDNSTKKAMLDRIAEAQETIKQIEAQKQAEIAEALNINSTMAPEDQMGGEIPQGMEEFTQNQMFDGGELTNGLSMLGQSGAFGQHTGINQLTTAADLGNTAFGKTGIDTSGATDIDPGSIKPGMMGVTGALKGAQAGAMFGPIGAGVGAAVGLGAGLIGGSRAKKDALKAHQNFEIGESNSKISNFAFGGTIGEPNSDNPNPPVNVSLTTARPFGKILEHSPTTSRLKAPIVYMDNNTTQNNKVGTMIYYKPKGPGFNPETDREFIYNENIKTLYNTPEYVQYMKNRNKFSKGGNIYDNGGNLTDPTKPWMLPKSTMADDPNLSGSGPFGFRKTFTGAPYSTELPSNQQIDINSIYNPNSLYKKSFNQMRKPIISDDLGFQSKLNYKESQPQQLAQPGNWYDTNNPLFTTAAANKDEGYVSPYPKAKLGETLNKVGQFAKDNYGNILRYSPVAMNALQLHKLNKAGYDTVNPIINDTRYNPQYMDEKALVNQINAESNYAGNALANASNGSMGALRSNILASQLAKTKGLSDAYSRVAEVNRNENKTGQQFNLGVDEANIARRVAAEDKTAMNKGNWETNKSRLLGQIGTDLGNIGLEQERNNMAEAMTGYTRKGKYLYKDDGTRVSANELKNTINNTMSSIGVTEKDGKYFDASGKELTSTDVLKMINSKNTTNQNRFGGYIMSKNFKK